MSTDLSTNERATVESLREMFTNRIVGMVSMWYPQAVGADGGALFAEHLTDALLRLLDGAR